MSASRLLAVSVTLACATVLSAFLAMTASAHPDEIESRLRGLVFEWAAARQGDESSLLESVLAPDFNGSSSARAAYLSSVQLRPIARIDTRFMRTNVRDGVAKIGPVVSYPYEAMKIPVAHELAALLVSGQWQLTSIQATELPEPLQSTDHPLSMQLHPVKVSVFDENGRGAFSRVSVLRSDGRYFAPDGHREQISTGWRQDVGGDVVIGGQTFAYVSPSFSMQLPVGSYSMEVWHGPEFEPSVTSFTVSASSENSVRVELKRWVDATALNWYAGDSHTHFLDPDTALLEARAEDLAIVNILASRGGNLVTSVNNFTGAPDLASDDRNIVFVGEETRHDFLGHAVLLGLRELIYPMGWGVPFTGVPGAYDYPTMAQQLDKAKDAGATVAWSHFPHPHGELPINVALGKVDAVETMVFGNPFSAHPARFYEGDVRPAEFSPLELWYALLNAGFDIPGLGATDKMWNTQLVGGVRTYVNLPEGLSYDGWLEGLRAGRSFFSSGPILRFTLEDQLPGATLNVGTPGQLRFNITASSYAKMDRVELIVNGEVVASKAAGDAQNLIQWSGEIAVSESSWVAARVISSVSRQIQSELTGEGTPEFAHANPVYVSLAGKPRVNAQSSHLLSGVCGQTLRWARQNARYPSQEAKSVALEIYERGCSVYQ